MTSGVKLSQSLYGELDACNYNTRLTQPAVDELYNRQAYNRSHSIQHWLSMTSNTWWPSSELVSQQIVQKLSA